MKQKFIAIALMSILAVGTVTGLAKTVQVGGGTWNYGTGSGRVYSEYYHASEIHGSSVVNGNGVKDTDYNRAKGQWSDASTSSTWKVDNSYYHVGKK
ncbi:MAG: lactococcin 972 family bacteriocin [Clostridium sp.]|uniref:lactococcin 972 family bacteriocin n=1 Tax=Clostridium TaxID=1485 RepID=UPI001883C0FC|nr:MULTISPECIES: lactococcin 972 family bacteriocin [Clostridium]MCR6514421.1 lactococcin 972 family bacteriocin [Clostridium sp. LY3-2]